MTETIKISQWAELKDSWVVRNVLARQAKERPNAYSIQWKCEPPLTYAQLYDHCLRVAGGLRDLGVQTGDSVLIMLPNSIEIVLAWLGTNLIGAVEVPINIHYKGKFLVHEANDSGARVAIIHAQYLGRFGEIAAELKYLRDIVIVGENGGTLFGNLDGTQWRFHSWETLISASKLTEPVPQRHFDTSAIMYTSGTTGPSKGVLIPYGLAGVFAQAIVEVGRLTSQDVYYVCLPLFHANAQFMQVLPCLLVGARVSIWPSFSASQWLEQIRACGATVTNTLGVMCEFIYRQPVRENDVDNPLRIMFTIPAPKDIAEQFEQRFGVKCLEGYGMTETSVFTYRTPDEKLRLGSAGRPLGWVDVIIGDPETDEPLPPGQVGEILVRPKLPGAFMKGYNNAPDKTVEAWRNLWFHTGDLGMMDEEGYLYFIDRAKDAIRRRGENISSYSIESIINAHPCVEECAAIAVPSEYGAGGEDEVKVCVVLKEGATLDPAELHQYCVDHMPYFAVPRYIEYVSSLPKTPNAKVRKVELRQRGITEETWDREKAGIQLKK